MFDLVIRNGDVVTPTGIVRADIGIEDGRISTIQPGLAAGRHEMDASEQVILPGLVDAHVHFNEPGREEWEGAATGSRAFAAGGGTLFFDMPLNSTPCTLAPAEFDAKRAALEASSITDFALWGGLTPGNRDHLEALAARGVIGFKAFLCDSGLPEFPRADDLTLYEGMREASRLGLPVAVHAESDEITRRLTQRLKSEGKCDCRAFLDSRPVIAEVEAIHRAALIARETRCKLQIVHVSTGSGVAAALEARALGTDITIETCPHYLFFTEDDMLRIGAAAKCAPPLRSAADRDALWTAVVEGTVDSIGSDHSPCHPDLKQSADFFAIWGGIAGVQSTLPVMLDQGYHRRGMPLADIARKLSTHPAERFGIHHKGRIEIGFDADLSIIDLYKSATLEPAHLFQRHAVSPYLGTSFRGQVRATIRRGELIFKDGAIVADTRGALVKPKRN